MKYSYLRFYVPLKKFFTYIEVEGLQNLGLCSALRAFEQGGIFAVTRDLGFSGLVHLVASYDTRGDVEDLF
jgi:hypothetical protein